MRIDVFIEVVQCVKALFALFKRKVVNLATVLEECQLGWLHFN